MSRRRVYSPQTLATIERFFEALDVCIEHKLVKNPYRFCVENGISQPHFYAQRKDLNRGYFEVSWLLPLIKVGISAMWLLTGKGLMFDSSMVSISLKSQPSLFD